MIFSSGACAGNVMSHEHDEDLLAAVCTAQKFLSKNGYFDHPPQVDNAALDLEIWDAIKFEQQGKIDFESLISSRRGQFTNKLFGAYKLDDLYVVTYKVRGQFRCVHVFEDLQFVQLVDATCKPTGNIVRFETGSLPASCM
jgi:hypothetical protein